MNRTFLPLLAAVLGASLACRHVGDYVWARDLPAAPGADPAYVIAPGDPVGRRNAQYPRPGGGPAF